ncbi:NADH-quinone oxidoreductase subunit G [Gordonia sp. NPDC003376]
MTALSDRPTDTEQANLVSATIDGIEIHVRPGTLVIRAAEQVGITIPRFCDHPLLAPVGACRQCLVDVEGQRKPLASCTTTVTEGMVVHTQFTSDAAAKAQGGVMELLLINHPLDCPICDKGGECPLQNQAMTAGRATSRFTGTKRTYVKPVPLSTAILLDRERCVLCARCTRFANQVAGDPLIDLADRGALQQVSTADGTPFDSYFAGNTVQICPVGALTGTDYRFRARPFDLVSTPGACEHCASGCAQRIDHRRGTVLRRLAADDPEVNQEWNCDKGRWAFAYATAEDRLRTPLVRDARGDLREVSWAQALRTAADGLATRRTGVLTGGRVTVEDAYGYSRYARTVLQTNDIDFRSRAHSAEETAFLADRIASRPDDLTYAQLVAAPTVLLVGFEPEEESPIVFLRLRGAVRGSRTRVVTIAPWRSPGNAKLSATLIPAAPGGEAEVLEHRDTVALLGDPNSVIVVGERLATSPGGLSAAVSLSVRTGARLVWIPRRAGDRGALEVGATPDLLPGGRPVTDDTARTEAAVAWGVRSLPAAVGRDTSAILAAAASGNLGALLVGGVDPADLPDPDLALRALDTAFVVSLEIRRSAVTDRADVVLPVAAVAEKSGTFLDWEGRARSFPAALGETGRISDHRVLDALAAHTGIDLECGDAEDIRTQLGTLGPWTGPRALRSPVPASPPPDIADGQAILSSWAHLLDHGRMQDGAPHLAGTAHPAPARLSAATATRVGVDDGDLLEIHTATGSLVLPLTITEMVDDVVWVPTNSAGAPLPALLGAGAGDVVGLRPGGDR